MVPPGFRPWPRTRRGWRRKVLHRADGSNTSLNKTGCILTLRYGKQNRIQSFRGVGLRGSVINGRRFRNTDVLKSCCFF